MINNKIKLLGAFVLVIMLFSNCGKNNGLSDEGNQPGSEKAKSDDQQIASGEGAEEEKLRKEEEVKEEAERLRTERDAAIRLKRQKDKRDFEEKCNRFNAILQDKKISFTEKKNDHRDDIVIFCDDYALKNKKEMTKEELKRCVADSRSEQANNFIAKTEEDTIVKVHAKLIDELNQLLVDLNEIDESNPGNDEEIRETLNKILTKYKELKSKKKSNADGPLTELWKSKFKQFKIKYGRLYPGCNISSTIF